MKRRKSSLKNFQRDSIIIIPEKISLDQVDIWFQDEARFGQQNTTTRLWAEKGSRPRTIRQQQFDYVHIFGAICPANGKTEAIISPVMNIAVMAEHLTLISRAKEAGRHALVIADGASWHNNTALESIDNVSIMKLPPYSPELNPIEQVWQWLRQNELANQAFSGYEEIVQKVSDAWNIFREDLTRVKSICTRDWAGFT
jgi:transposase